MSRGWKQSSWTLKIGKDMSFFSAIFGNFFSRPSSDASSGFDLSADAVEPVNLRHLATETDPAFAHEANNIFHGTSLDPTQASSSVLESELQSEDGSNSGYSITDDDSVGLSHLHGMTTMSSPNDELTDPAYAFMPGNIYHDTPIDPTHVEEMPQIDTVTDPSFSHLPENIYHDTAIDPTSDISNDSFSPCESGSSFGSEDSFGYSSFDSFDSFSSSDSFGSDSFSSDSFGCGSSFGSDF